MLEQRKDIDEIIDHDKLLDGHDVDNANLVFMDISLDIHNRVQVASVVFEQTVYFILLVVLFVILICKLK